MQKSHSVEEGNSPFLIPTSASVAVAASRHPTYVRHAANKQDRQKGVISSWLVGGELMINRAKNPVQHPPRSLKTTSERNLR